MYLATVLATIGVIIPFVLGTLLAIIYVGGFDKIATDKDLFLNCLLIGTIMTATSVGITVETLRELGKLNSEMGTIIVSAAVIDDVLGIIVLSIVTSLKNGGNIWLTILKAILFFIVAIAFGLLLRYIFKKMVTEHPHTRREGIYAEAVCLLYGFVAEKFFGIASITGAYIAGLMLSGLKDSPYIEKRVLQLGYLIFSPIFFAYIGISANFSNFSLSTLLFGLAFVIVAILGKLLAGFIAGKCFGYSSKQGLQLGSGMVARGEVALAVYGTGATMICSNGIDPIIGVILLILASSIICPILLKVLFKENKEIQLEQQVQANNTENAEVINNDNNN